MSRILILDGAIGTMLQQREIRSSCGISDALNLENPEAIGRLHCDYIEAGADIITTNTFNNLSPEVNLAGARIARRAADAAGRKVLVAGSVGPTAKMLSLSSDASRPDWRPASFFEQERAFEEQIRALRQGGVDMLLFETVFDPINARAALYAAAKIADETGEKLPLMVSATVNDRSGRLLTGQSAEALYWSLESYGLFSFGLNCSFGAADLAPILERLSPQVRCAISIYPNAGLPNEEGGYDEKPDFTAGAIAEMARKGLVNIAGGCCGTTPDHIRAIRDALEGIPAREIPAQEGAPLVVTGLDCIPIDLKESNFVNVGERTNVAGSRKFAKLIAAGDYAGGATVARNQIAEGASVIDINMDDAMLDSRAEMERFVRFIANDPDISRAALMIDSSGWETLLAGITNSQGRCIVNSLSLKEGEEKFLRRAAEIRRLGAAAIVMAFDEEGQATTYGRKVAVCRRAFDLLTRKAGMRPQDIIFDVNILTIGTGLPEHARYAVDFIEAVRWIKENLPGCRTSGGVSNLSFAFRGNNPVREAMHSVFLYHAINAGLDMAIVNAGALQPYDSIDPELRKAVEDVILDSDPQATSRLVEIAGKYREQAAEGPSREHAEAWRSLPAGERLEEALIRGTSEYLEADLAEAGALLSPMELIEGPLLKGMERVGALFGEGKLFLPQVIRSAQVMRSAVAILEPALEASKGHSGRTRRRMVLATAQGDIHDIGKNILSAVLSCNGIDVIDLGVMVEGKTILEAIKREKADMVGISGLITPSLVHMEELCRLMEAEGMTIPLFVGGATTSALHTAVKLAPLYSHAVIHTSSASECAAMVGRYLADPEGCISTVKEKQEELRRLHASRNERYVTLEEARSRAVKHPLKSFIQPEGFGEKEIFEQFMPLERITRRINWQMFLSFWGFKGDFKRIVAENPKAAQCYEDGMAELARMIINRSVEMTLRARFFDACADNEAIVLPEEGIRLEMGRATSTLTGFESLADYFPPQESGYTSRLGLFVVKVRDLSPHCNGDKCGEYPHLIRSALCQRLAEAAAEWLSDEAACGGHLIRPAFGYAACPDHTLKREAFRLLDAPKLGMALTSSCVMIPATSVCGMLISHPAASYIRIRTDEGH